MAWSTPVTQATGVLVTAAIWNGDLVNNLIDLDAMRPWLIDVDVFPTAIAQTNWDTIALPAGSPVFYGNKSSSGAQNAEINWDVVLAAGTWTIELIHHTFTDTGIYTVQLGGVTKGTIDGYSAGDVVNVRSSVTGIVVASSGKVRLKLLMATKNASASSYTGRIQHVQLRRTA